MRLSGSQWNINDVDNGTDYTLWVKNWKISSLEGFTYEEKWPDEIIWANKAETFGYGYDFRMYCVGRK